MRCLLVKSLVLGDVNTLNVNYYVVKYAQDLDAMKGILSLFKLLNFFSCKKKLKCGHNCIGLCGEICPKVCRVCDPENKIFQIVFGNEDEPGTIATFYYMLI